MTHQRPTSRSARRLALAFLSAAVAVPAFALVSTSVSSTAVSAVVGAEDGQEARREAPPREVPSPDAPSRDMPSRDAPPPARAEQSESSDSPEAGRGQSDDGRRGHRRPGEEVTGDEWLRLQAFMAEHSPNKWRMYLSLPDRPVKQNLRRGITHKFRLLERVKLTDPERHRIETDAIKIEDQIYGVLQAMRDDPESQEGREPLLRQLVDQLVHNRDQWRKCRLERVYAELKNMNVVDAMKPVEEEIKRVAARGEAERSARVDGKVREFRRQIETGPVINREGRSDTE